MPIAAMPGSDLESVTAVSHGLASPAIAPAQPASKTGPIRLKDDANEGMVSTRARSDRHEPVSLSAADAYEPFGTIKEPQPVPWKLIAAGIILIGTTIAITKGYTPSSTPILETVRKVAPSPAPQPAAAPPVAANAGRLTITTQPPGAHVAIDGKSAGDTPLTLDTIGPGRHVITLTSPGGASAKRTVRVEAGKTVAIDVPLFSGFALISAPFVIEVSENGKALGSGDDQILLSPGSHTLRVANKDLGYVATEIVEIQPGEVTRLALDPRGRANINAAPWAEVYIDGEKAGETPMANVAIRLGIREIVFKNPQFGERKVTTTITANAPATISVDFIK
jgi:PEGA domain-containing protein